MSDMPEIIWVYDGAYDDHTWVEHDPSYNDYIGGGTKYIRQSAINVPDGLEGAIDNAKKSLLILRSVTDTDPLVFATNVKSDTESSLRFKGSELELLMDAARELLRLKGLGHGQD